MKKLVDWLIKRRNKQLQVDNRIPINQEIWTYLGFNEPIEFIQNMLPQSWYEKLHDKSNYYTVIAQSEPKLEGIPVIVPRHNELDSLIWFGLKFTCEEECQCHADCDLATKTLPTIPYYTQKDIEKAIKLARIPEEFNEEDDSYTLLNVQGILEQINSISVIEVDEQFNILSYE